jgi:hypothetical protein
MKTRQVLVLREVSQDLEEGKIFYNGRAPGIGDYFFDSIVSDIESLLLYGGIHSKHFGFFRMLASRFPFAIYYTVLKDIAIVGAVLDMRREPAWIQDRLEERKEASFGL